MSDPFLRADPVWINAQRLGARSGSAFEVTPARRRTFRIACEFAAVFIPLGMVCVAFWMWGR